ncbi:DUF3823 domain-containing protein [Algoriphagus machipongonensis]|uniref:DUF3823 domain-containing protein n=1 Tax=Algoriphagus machipongonensis TaxID=388413 RepID=A3HV05_9BACT|nr:DUF3823 domain-containing protein [Algoriphagus machipongonensis]EAZ81977.1 hypothetical protein ALPR1_02010 [Algoriphagus machipongonensis]
MKLNFKNILGMMGIAAFLTSCNYDNYDEPSYQLDGRIVYQGEPIGVSYNDVYIELWESGWQRLGNIGVAVDQDGSYSSLLFKGDYKMIIPNNQGPFQKITNDQTGNDTIPVNLTGSRTMDIEVMPYYMIRNVSINGGSDQVSATFDLDQIITGDDARNIQEVSLYVSKTSFVDIRTSIATTNRGGGDLESMTGISLGVDVPERVPTQNYAYARVGVRIEGVEDMIFSEIVKVDL